MEKARARVKIYENKNQDQKMKNFKIEEHKHDNITYHQQTTKRSEINQHSDRKNVGTFTLTFTAAFLEKNMTRNYSVHLDKHHEQIQLKLQF